MRFSTKLIASIVGVVVATAYGFARLSGEPDDADEQSIDAEYQTPGGENQPSAHSYAVRILTSAVVHPPDSNV